ncbi:hypothetical protein jhhlp_002449 [Lomentospora prolificans]|uniref:BZIP domain-containing protein n=1 Tax=Lomentospora prolificans TaxID=41688 RepID=A0A2N3NE49_9PEZI|nr:hypothetical protein jhhlp_002449 [Lomentospora prolificans]
MKTELCGESEAGVDLWGLSAKAVNKSTMAAAFSDKIYAAHSPQAKLEPSPRNPSLGPPQQNHSQSTISTTPTPNIFHPPSIKPNLHLPNGPLRVSIRPNSLTASPTVASPSNAHINKMSMASVISPDPTPAPQLIPKVSMTTKEWVVPPRPKPGRKPATDTPPTKRKAQNRAAQRAFRERRAARVGELEEQLEEQREERDKAERELKDKIRILELDLQSFRSKCSLLENLLERERQERIRVESEAENLRRRSESTFSNNHNPGNNLPSIQHSPRYVGSGNMQYNQTHSMQPSTASESRPLTRTAMQAFAISQIISPPDPSDPLSSAADLTCGNCQPGGPCACVEAAIRSVQDASCGKCGLGGTCQCIEDTINSIETPLLPPLTQQPKRSSSPSNGGPSGKRLRAAPSATPVTSIETDFTNAFKKKAPLDPLGDKPSQLSTEITMDMTPRITIPPKDACGFCEDGTYCVCAEAALSSASMAESSDSTSSLPSIFSHESRVTEATQGLSPPPEPETMAPMPMEVTSTGAIKLRQRQRLPKSAPTSSSSDCGPGGPGTCAQCLADPQSGLFCRTLAAINGAGNKNGGGCCGGAGPGGGCCKSNNNGSSNASKTRPIGISIADTYKTLSTHRNFDQAFEEIGTWLPKLKVVKRREEDEPSSPNRPATEIDVASIMTTLKFLDVRFRANKQ